MGKYGFTVAATALLLIACASTPAPDLQKGSPVPLAGDTILRPAVDHHQHLMSPALAQLWSEPEEAPIALPPELARVLQGMSDNWKDASRLAALYSSDAILLDDNMVNRGQDLVAKRLSSRFGAPYELRPLALTKRGDSAQVLAHFVRVNEGQLRPFGFTLISLFQERLGIWRIRSQATRFPGPFRFRSVDGSALVRLLDQAGIARAVVLSMAYAFSSKLYPTPADYRAATALENDWTSAQVSRFSDRLVGFCAVNPLADYALEEVRRCSNLPGMEGLKLHFANSGVDVTNPDHIKRLQTIFTESNRLTLPIVAHIWVPGGAFGRRHAEIFLSELLPHTPDVVVQIAHMAGGGPGWNDDAFQVFSNAIRANDPRTRNVFFDVATVADRQTPEQLELLATRIREVGPDRILYGSDAAGNDRDPPSMEWAFFRGMIPLTEREISTIAANVAPYLRRQGSAK